MIILVELIHRLRIIISFSLLQKFRLSQKLAVDRPILKCDCIRYTPASLNLMNGENNQAFIDIPREDSAISLKDSYLALDFIVTH